MDCQVKRIHLRATVSVLVAVGVVAGGRQGLRRPVRVRPGVGLARRLRLGEVLRGVHRQVQGHHAVAAIDRLVGERRGCRRRFRVFHAVPREAVARHRRRVARRAVVDRHIQRHHAVAAAHILELVRVNAARRDRRVAVRPAPHVAVAFRHGKNRGLAALVDRHIQRHHAVAATSVLAD